MLTDRLGDSQTLDAAADILDRPPLDILGGGLASQLRGFAAMLRHEPTHERGRW